MDFIVKYSVFHTQAGKARLKNSFAIFQVISQYDAGILRSIADRWRQRGCARSIFENGGGLMSYPISRVFPGDRRTLAQIDALLEQEGICRDAHLDYICAMYDEDDQVIAVGGCFGNTLRCLAVSGAHQGEGLLSQIAAHLIGVQMERGHRRLFLYTKIAAAPFFRALGFHEIVRVEDTLVFMENRRSGFDAYLQKLSESRREGRAAALVMNANPFTLGHQYLVEKAAAAWDTLHLFLVSEDASLIPFDVRMALARAGTAHLPNVVIHETGPYLISSATFPSYFLREEDAVIRGHALLDLAVFTRIARALGITCRYVGEEPASRVTGLYNQIMAQKLPEAGIECRVVPRLEAEGCPISASAVRCALRDGDWTALRKLVPASTCAYFAGPEAAPVLERLRQAGDVAHY